MKCLTNLAGAAVLSELLAEISAHLASHHPAEIDVPYPCDACTARAGT